MGQQLFEPPDVNGWELGQGWFSTAACCSRMNFAASLTTNQRVNLRNEARPFAKTPQSVMSFVMDRLSPTPFETAPYNELLGYLRAGTNWTGSDNELQAKVAGRDASGAGLGVLPDGLAEAGAEPEGRYGTLPDGNSCVAAWRRSPGALPRRHSFATSRWRRARLAQPGGALSRRRQRLAEHGHPLHRPDLLRAPADDRRASRPTCCRSARTAGTPLGLHPRHDGLLNDLQSGPAARSSSAPAIRT